MPAHCATQTRIEKVKSQVTWGRR